MNLDVDAIPLKLPNRCTCRLVSPSGRATAYSIVVFEGVRVWVCVSKRNGMGREAEPLGAPLHSRGHKNNFSFETRLSR